MPDATHTPGPWRPHHKGSTRVIAVVPGDPTEVHTICNTWRSPLSPPRWEAAANARLIAAAPDLLESLETLLLELECDGAASPHAVRRARAAVAKATTGA